MADREKVIKEYENYVKRFVSLTESDEAEYEMHEAVLALLKEQEPKAILDIADPIDGIEVGKCPRCDRTILNKQSDPTWFCKYCGQAVKFK